jgi:phage tail sheath gpL-like
MAQNGISLAAARGNFLTWCISGTLPLQGLCRPLYIGQMITGADGVVGEFYTVYSTNEARRLFGAGSILATMAAQHFCTCPELPLYMAPVPEPTGGAAAVNTITITGPATNNGVLSLAIMDMNFAVGVITGATADSMATALAAQMTMNTNLPFTVTHALGVITLTAKNKGPEGGWFAPIWNPNFGDAFPAGVTAVSAQTTPGTGVVDINPAIPAMACPWDCIALGTEDEIAVNTMVQLVRQNWACGVQGDFKGGGLYHSRTDSAGQIAAYGMDRNNPEEVVVPVRTGYKYPGYMLAAATASRVCCTACTDPSRPVQYDNGILGCMFDTAQCSSLWTSEEKKAFYDAGIMNWDVANARGIRATALWIEEPLTTYKYDPLTGAPDGAWQRVESRYTVAKFVRDLGFWYRRNYSSVALLSDGTRIPQGKRAVTPRILQASILAWLRGTQLGFTAEADSAQLEKMVTVQRTNTPNNCDPNRVNVLIDLDLVNQLARIATSINASPEFACIPPTAQAA